MMVVVRVHRSALRLLVLLLKLLQIELVAGRATRNTADVHDFSFLVDACRPNRPASLPSATFMPDAMPGIGGVAPTFAPRAGSSCRGTASLAARYRPSSSSG
jgi:hypothetical protein